MTLTSYTAYTHASESAHALGLPDPREIQDTDGNVSAVVAAFASRGHVAPHARAISHNADGSRLFLMCGACILATVTAF
jgi:hypothetical protein